MDFNSWTCLSQKGQLVLVFHSRMGKIPRNLKLWWSGPFSIFADCVPTILYLADLRDEILPILVNGFCLRHYFAPSSIQCPFSVAKTLMATLMNVVPRFFHFLELCADFTHESKITFMETILGNIWAPFN